MNKRFFSVVAFAILVAAAASYVVFRLISTRLAASAKPAGTQIVVAARDLQVGTLIKDLDLSTAEWQGTPPKGTLLAKEEVVGRGVIAPIYQGEPLLDSRIAAKGAGAGMAATIPPGMRAVAVRVNDVVGVAGFVTPGMRVDILIAGNPPGVNTTHTGTITKTLLQNIEVLSAGQNIQKDAEGKPVSVPVINLLVTPDQAEILSLASNETRIQLVLRNPVDTEIAKTTGTAVANLFSGGTGPLPIPPSKLVGAGSKPAPVKRGAARPVVKASAPAKLAAPPASERIVIPVTVEIYHGAARAEVKFKEEQPGNSTSQPEAKN